MTASLMSKTMRLTSFFESAHIHLQNYEEQATSRGVTRLSGSKRFWFWFCSPGMGQAGFHERESCH